MNQLDEFLSEHSAPQEIVDAVERMRTAETHGMSANKDDHAIVLTWYSKQVTQDRYGR